MKSLLLTAALVAATSALALAQTPADGGPAPAAPAAPTDTPLDGGVILLLAGGLGYAVRRLRQRHAR